MIRKTLLSSLDVELAILKILGMLSSLCLLSEFKASRNRRPLSLDYLSEDLRGIEILIRHIAFALCFFFLASRIYECPKRSANKWQRR